MKKRIKSIISQLSRGLYERDEFIAIMLLCTIAQVNQFLLGPPGTSKSYLSSLMKLVLKESVYFETLMSPYTKPEELFGPLSISAFKEDRQEFNTKGYLPEAHIANLDEIWKASPPILTTLLTIINEKKFKNGAELIDAVLIFLVCASNETPGPELAALYDRLPVRMIVPDIQNNENFLKVIDGSPLKPSLDENLKLTIEEVQKWQNEIHKVTLSEDSKRAILAIKEKIETYINDTYRTASTRRWKSISKLLKTSAFLCGRQEVNLLDCLNLRYCLWDTEENYQDILTIVDETIADMSLVSSINFSALSQQKSWYEKEIDAVLHHTEDIYEKTNLFNGEDMFSVVIHASKMPYTLYIRPEYINSKEDFHPLDKNLKPYSTLTCSFEGGRECLIKGELETELYSKHASINESLKPGLLFAKGSLRNNPDYDKLTELHKAISGLYEEYQNVYEQMKKEKRLYEEEYECIFISEEQARIPVMGINRQLESIELELKGCKLLMTQSEPQNA